MSPPAEMADAPAPAAMRRLLVISDLPAIRADHGGRTYVHALLTHLRGCGFEIDEGVLDEAEVAGKVVPGGEAVIEEHAAPVV